MQLYVQIVRLTFVLLLVSCGREGRAASPAAPPALHDARIRATMTELHVPGMAVAVVRDGAVIERLHRGVANLEWQAPVTDDTRFQIASATKVFTGTLVMLLVQDGTLALDDRVTKHLPEAPPAWRDITIAHLAAHVAGIPEPASPPLGTLAEEVKRLATQPLAFAPGTRAAYGLGDFLVLAHVLETVTRQRFVDLLRTRLFDPLGFTCTTFEDARDTGPTRRGAVIPKRASVYRWADGRQQTAWFLYPESTYASGGIFSCLTDLTRWAIAMDRGTLLTPASERRAATAFPLANGDTAGYSVVFATGTVRGRPSYGHSGGPALADIVRVPDHKLTVIVLANQQRLYPNLAPARAAELLPAVPTDALRDAAPDLTRAHQRLLAQLLRASSAATFDDAVATPLAAELRTWGPVLTAPFGRVRDLVLVHEQGDDTRRIRAYRAVHERGTLRWSFTLDSRGQIVKLDQRSD